MWNTTFIMGVKHACVFSRRLFYRSISSLWRLCVLQADESVSHNVLLSIVRHFQHLFDVPTVSGIYPRMSEVYSRCNEMKNVLKTLADLLDLGSTVRLLSPLICPTYLRLISVPMSAFFRQWFQRKWHRWCRGQGLPVVYIVDLHAAQTAPAGGWVRQVGTITRIIQISA